MIQRITSMYFSPTHTTKAIVTGVCKGLQSALSVDSQEVDLTLPGGRQALPSFGEGDLLVLGLPVYAGRIPLLMAEYLRALSGKGAWAIPLVVYGNRDYDDALLEVADILADGGFTVLSAGAFIGEHSFTNKVATGRPDETDRSLCEKFGADSAALLLNPIKKPTPPTIRGNRPYKERNPSPPMGPHTTDACTHCGICPTVCPTAAIDFSDETQVEESLCLRCCACVKSCPEGAKHFPQEGMQNSIIFLIDSCSDYREPELFL
ncbi:(4Fe-4S)-binding protein [Eubacteriales bacterium OttesenSCG-928-M02]|nr:(4Fe-4S)-binding protein [Eubacteriales bacterium OttesenSCG-928-M02]